MSQAEFELGFDPRISYEPAEIMHSMAAEAVYMAARLLVASQQVQPHHSYPTYLQRIIQNKGLHISILQSGDTTIPLRGIKGVQAGEYRGSIVLDEHAGTLSSEEYGIFKAWGSRELKVLGTQRTVLVQKDTLYWYYCPLANSNKAFRLAGLLSGVVEEPQQ